MAYVRLAWPLADREPALKYHAADVIIVKSFRATIPSERRLFVYRLLTLEGGTERADLSAAPLAEPLAWPKMR